MSRVFGIKSGSTASHLWDCLSGNSCPYRQCCCKSASHCYLLSVDLENTLFQLAVRFRTYDVPLPSDGVKEVVNMFQKVSKKIRPTMFYMLLGQAFLGSVVTYFEASNLINISKKYSAQLSSQSEFTND